MIIDGERYYTSEEIGAFLGISAEEVDKIAKANGIMPPQGESNEYGRWITRRVLPRRS